MLPAIAWSLTILLMLAGLVGVIVPLMPGTLLILGAVIVHKLILPGSVSWTLVAVVAAIWALSMLADIGAVLLGTRWFGGSKWGVTGAGGGAFVGLFFSVPALILATVLGAVLAEKLIARRSGRESLKAGVGAATGFVLSVIARSACALAMIACFLVAALGPR